VGKTDTTITWIEPKATDNVAVSSFTSSMASGSKFPVGTTTVTYTAKDAAGNTTTASFAVTIKSAADAEKPVITGIPATITATIAVGKTDTTITWIEPKATDNVAVSSFTSSMASGSKFPVGTTTVTYTAMDAAGNTTIASFAVTIKSAADAEKPVITGIPATITATIAVGKTDTTITWVEPKATDNVAVTSFTSSMASGSKFALGTTTVTYTAKDAAGNTTIASFAVTI